MSRTDAVTLAIVTVIVGAVALRDWRPAPVELPSLPMHEAKEERGPERLRLEMLETQRSGTRAGTRDLFRYAEVARVAPRAGQTTRGDGLSYLTSRVATPAAVAGDGFPLRFYGYAKRPTEAVQAFFYDDEQIYVAAEGEVIDGRYRVVRIGTTTAEIEDLGQHTQRTLTMEADAVTS